MRKAFTFMLWLLLLLAALPQAVMASTTYDISALGAGHDYNVTVVYNQGESALSNTVSVASAIGEVRAATDRPATVYSVSGQVLGRTDGGAGIGRNAFGHGIIIVNGKKYVNK